MADAARARKIADRIKEVVAANLASLVKDPDLGFVTVEPAGTVEMLLTLTR